jgi:hypothetical protein
MLYLIDEKYLKKALVSLQKGSTFAPAKREGKDRIMEERLAKFFESLRPAQDQRRGDAPRGKEPFRRNTKRTSRRNPRFRTDKKKQQ